MREIKDHNPEFKHEIIIVNDGSTDNTPGVVAEFSNNHSSTNLRVINKTNSGVSDSRNIGLYNAVGKYVWFFDSDDLIFKGIGKQLNNLCRSNPDIIKFSSITVDNSIKDAEKFNNSTSSKILFKGKYRHFLSNNIIGFACWSIIIKRELLLANNILFNTEFSISEDVLFNLEIARKLPDALIIVTDLKVVKYIVNYESAVNTSNYYKNYTHLISSINFHNLLTSSKYSSNYLEKSILSYTISSTNQTITRFLSCKLDKKDRIEINNIISDFMAQSPTSTKIISFSDISIGLSQFLYRNIFLRYIKKYIKRN